MIITEAHIRKIVSESLSSLLLEFDMGGAIGRCGHITTADLEDPKQLFSEELKKANEIKQKNKENPKYRVSIKKVFGDTEAYKVYQNYYTAMMSKPGKKAINFFTWLKFVCEGKMGQKIMAYCVDGSYLFGFWIRGYFMAAYFAPVGFTGMAKLIKGLCQYDNVIFAVTQDMSPMLERLGIPKADKTHDAPWRGKMVTKDVFGTSENAIRFGFKVLDFATMCQK